MKKKCAIAVAMICILAAQSFASGMAAENALDFSKVLGKNWTLEEIRTGQTVVRINRSAGTNAIFTLMFEAERVSGVGAPNRYFGPYARGESAALSFGAMASTMMAALFENEALKEHEYFAYLAKVFRWDMRNGKLMLYTLNPKNEEVILVYTE